MHHSIELGVTLGHVLDLVIFVHLGQVVPILGQVLTGDLPPDWEVFLDRASQVRSVRSRLSHNFVEGLALNGNVLRLLMHEEGECHSYGHAD